MSGEAAAVVLIVAGLTLAGSSQAKPPRGPKPPATAKPAASGAPSAAPSGAPSAAPSAASSAAPAASGAPAAPPTAEEIAAAEAAAEKKEQARAHFERGVSLSLQGLIAPALAEFLQSRSIYPTRNATKNAATCLRQLERYDESLDMLEAFLREFADAPASEKASVEKEVDELRGMLGTITIEGAEVGATIVIDERGRGEYPPVAPLRVGAGSHRVRIIKGGFEPFETRVDVAGGLTVRLNVAQKALLTSGRLRVLSVGGGASVNVVVDGSIVGKTPWEGALSVGPHSVLLRGDGTFGSQPAQANVEAQKLTSLTLAVEPLGAALSVDAQPAGATIAIDSVMVARGLWEGRLRVGSHTIELAAEGFLPKRRDVSLREGATENVQVVLERDPDDVRWAQPSKVIIDAALGLGIAPSFGGDVAGGCTGACSLAPGLGVVGSGFVGYEFGSGLGFGVSVGYLFTQETIEDRPVSVKPQGLSARSGVADETLRVSGVTFGAAASFHLRQKYPMLFRLGVGGLFGSVGDGRKAAFQPTSDPLSQAYTTPLIADSRRVNQLYLAPEIRVGLRQFDRVEFSAGLAALILISPSTPKWGEDAALPIVLPDDGYSVYPAETLSGKVFVILTPSVSARFEL